MGKHVLEGIARWSGRRRWPTRCRGGGDPVLRGPLAAPTRRPAVDAAAVGYGAQDALRRP